MESEVPLVAEVVVLRREMAWKEALVAQQREHVAQQREHVARAQSELAAREAEAKRKRTEVAEAERKLAQCHPSWRMRIRLLEDPAWRDWGNALGEGLPEEVLAKVAGKVVAQTEAGEAARLKECSPRYWTEWKIQ